jgi:hypothetical protein
MIKIELSSNKMICNSGAAVALDMLQKLQYDSLVDDHLGERVKFGGYKHSDILKTLFISQICGGSCVEDVQQLRWEWEQHPTFKVCSPDTVLRLLSELKQEDTVIPSLTSKTGVVHYFNVNMHINELLVKVGLRTGLLQSYKPYTLDYDNVVTPCEKYDAKCTYKSITGYQPAVASIGNLPVYIEGRNGNSNARFEMEQTLKNTFAVLDAQGIQIKKFRSDSAAYLKEVIDLMNERKITFYIRAMLSTKVKSSLPNLEWKTIKYNDLPVEIAETTYVPFRGKQRYRLIVHRKKREDRQLDAFTKDCYEYHGIITTDMDSTPAEIFGFYNQRGTSEKLFDVLKNDFNWNHLPSSFLAENTVYMILSAISCVLFEWLKSNVKQHFSGILQTHRLKQFIFRFVSVAGKWIHKGRQYFLKIFSLNRYDLLLLKT